MQIYFDYNLLNIRTKTFDLQNNLTLKIQAY
jgi:hypothetical protein